MTTMRFIASRKPLMQSGDYEITVEQTLELPEKAKEIFTTTKEITVASERFSLQPHDIFAVYPGSGSRKNYADVLPHIVLSRSTLPWERSFPWLALLVFHEDEPVAPQIISLQQLQATNNEVTFPDIILETGQQDDDKVMVIDVPKKLLEQIMPTQRELTALTHVRQREKADGATIERSVIISNRLPQKAGISTAYLVSVENRFTKKGVFDFQETEENDEIRLVVLHNWPIADEQFYQIPKDTTDKILSNAWLKVGNELFRGKKAFLEKLKSCQPDNTLTLDESADKKLLNTAMDNTPVFKRFLTDLDSGTLTMPITNNDDSSTARRLSQGAVPLAHHLRDGNKNAAWYHGPLLPGKKKDHNIKPDSSTGLSSDHLYQYDAELGMLDVSYAAAWELGQLLCLKNQAVSGSLFTMKREAIQHDLQKKQLNKEKYQHLPLQNGLEVANPPVDKDVEDWFNRLKLLELIPFNYLVPREEMLPEESIRFFKVDPFWLDCLLDGALSVGGAIPQDDENIFAGLREQTGRGKLCGFLLRSELVSIWPKLLITANDMKPIRKQIVGENILLCLFEIEDMNNVSFQQSPETLHFGLDRRVDEAGVSNFFIQSQGGEGEKNIDISWKNNDKDKRVIRIDALADQLGEEKKRSVTLATATLKGSQKVLFTM